MDLIDVRKKIDEIDEQLVALFEDRLGLVADVAAYKEAHNLAIYDQDREAEVLARNVGRIKSEELAPYVERYLTSVMTISRKYQKDHINQPVFIIGMPGSGKTTVGKALAQRLGVEFFDVDGEIQKEAGKSIQNIIIHDGEPAFRELEYQVIEGLVSSHRASVIATGGGTVLSEKTAKLMRDSGFVIFIHRDVTQILDDLDLEIRPLLKENIEYIFRLYEERCPLYEKVCHVKIQNISNISDCVDEIITHLPNREK